MRVAFATKDGKFISQHFGHTPAFCIVEIDEQSYTWRVLERRENTPPCSRGRHDDDALLKSVQALADCSALFAVKVGPYAKTALQQQNMQVLEVTGFIEDALEGYIIYLKKQKERGRRHEAAV